MSQKALFRLDSGGQFGLGHVMRSKALADALLDLSIKSTFAAVNIHSNSAVKPHTLIELESEDEFLFLAQSYDVIIVDHYGYTSELFFELSQLKQSILVLLDDECNRGALYADMVCNPVKGTELLPYKEVAPNANLLLGSEYIIIRSLFLRQEQAPLFELSAFKRRKSLVVTFGGSDVRELTIPVLNLIHQSSLSEFEVIVVTSVGFQNVNNIEALSQQYHFQHLHDVENMAAVFSQAKLAISAAGSTAFELAYCGVPSVFAVVADNQLLSIREQCQSGWCQMVDCREKSKSLDNAAELVLLAEKMLSTRSLEALSQKAQNQIDGRGAQRIASSIQKKMSEAQ